MKSIFRRGLAFFALLPGRKAHHLYLHLESESEYSADLSITEDVFPDPIFRQWLMDPSNLNGAGADGVFTQAELAVFFPSMSPIWAFLHWKESRYFTPLNSSAATIIS